MEKYSNRTLPLHLSTLAVLIALGSVVLPNSAHADCLSCPPVAWHVDAVSTDSTVEGYLALNEIFIEKKIDVADWLKREPLFKDYLADARIWRRALSVAHVFDGLCLEQPRQAPRRGDQPELEAIRTEPCSFTLPSQHLLLMGPGEPLLNDDLLQLREKTAAEGPVPLRWPVFKVGEVSALELARGPRIAIRYLPSDPLIIAVYCFAFESGPKLAALEKLCQSDPLGETWPTFEGDGWLMLIDYGGS